MPDDASLIPEARAFYTQLDANNTRDWWQENRAPYDAVLKPGALALLEKVSGPLSDLTDTPITTKLFRPHRDVRFSKDKRPYNTHLHMMWQMTVEAPQAPVFFFGIGLDYVTVGAGMMGFDKPVLENWRKFVDLDTARVVGIVESVEAKGFARRAPDLKRVPPAYDKDHPGADLLRHKGFVVTGDIAENTPELPKTLLAAFKALWPINALLLQVAEA